MGQLGVIKPGRSLNLPAWTRRRQVGYMRYVALPTWVRSRTANANGAAVGVQVPENRP